MNAIHDLAILFEHYGATLSIPPYEIYYNHEMNPLDDSWGYWIVDTRTGYLIRKPSSVSQMIQCLMFLIEDVPEEDIDECPF